MEEDFEGGGYFSRLWRWLFGGSSRKSKSHSLTDTFQELPPKKLTYVRGDTGSMEFDPVVLESKKRNVTEFEIHIEEMKQYEAQNLTGNVIYLNDESRESELEQSKYVLVTEDSAEQIDKVAADMTWLWNMSTPKLVLTLISSAPYFKPWKRQQELEDFQDGLMKAASLTEMWILLDGRNADLTSMVGEAVSKEKSRRNILKTEQTLVRFPSQEPLPDLTVIGVMCQSDLADGTPTHSKMPSKGEALTIVVEDSRSDYASQRHKSFSPFLTHMIVTSAEMSHAAFNSFILKLEMSLIKSVEQERVRSVNTGETEKKTETVTTPLIGLLIDGGTEDIDHVLALLRKGVPVIVVCSQGKAAALIAFAYRAAQQSYGTDNYETYVKTELLNRLTEYFPKEFRDNNLSRNQYRDKILQCVAYATKGDYALITLIERNTTYELKDLSKVILNAVLTSHTAQGENVAREEIRLNMQLIIDWIQPELAVTEIFDKHGSDKFWIDEDQFEQVLLRPGREEFVELFLERGFLLYKYLNPRRLEMLFEKCSDKDFFVSICLEAVLGEKMTFEKTTSEDFVKGKDNDLNHILAILTGLKHLIDPLQLSLNTSADRAEDVVTAEHRALHALLYWSVLTNNQKLVRIFWSRTSEPVAMALVLSTIHKRLSQSWISNHDLKLKMKAVGVEYGQLAIQMLDLCYSESKTQTLNSLRTKLATFNNYTVMDLAMIGKNKYFIAHPACQKIIFDMWYGKVRISQRHAFFSDNVKIFLCILLVFPTYFWIETVSDKKKSISSRSKHTLKKSFLSEKIAQTKIEEYLCSMQFFYKLYQLWKAPVVKFLFSQIFFSAFLIYFMYAVAAPFCGHQLTNVYISVWLLAYICDHIYIVVVRKMFCDELPIFANLRAMAVFAYTLAVIVLFRLMFPGYLSFATVKILLSFSLTYFCYLAMGFFFPISPVFGPMLVNISVMMKRDLITWLKMWAMTFISGSVAIHAALYPAYPFSLSSVWRALKRGIFALFITDVADIRAGGQCTCLYNYTSSFGCETSSIPASVQEKLEPCVNNSFPSYLILLQYIFITKLVYLTLIFTITRVTLATTYEKSVEIWKYQLFLLVINNKWRPLLPVPVVLLYYPFIIMKCCYHAMNYMCYAWCPCCSRIKEKPAKVNDLNIWRGLMRLHKKNERLKQDQLNQARNAKARLKVLAKDQIIQGKQMDSLNDRLFGVINSQTTLSLTLEHMKHVMQELANKNYQTAGDVLPLRTQHTKCRMSPYHGTSVRRYPVFDKNVSWEENYPAYDPPAFSRPEEDYDEELRPYIDPDLFVLMKQREERDKLAVEEEGETTGFVPPEFNAEVESTTYTGDRYTVDRTCWITKDDQQVQYLLDSSGVPRNPMGRTGLRGRGNLWRWGPNHMIYAIVSRWKYVTNAFDNSQTLKLVNGKKVMEILVVHNDLLNEDSLPGGFISGRNSKYNVICEVFMTDVLGEKDVPSTTQLDQDDMIQFFRQFVLSDLLSGILGRTMPATSSLASSLVHRGYMDDSNNTDNAWVEAEVWSFHYHSKDRLDNKTLLKDKHWREVSSVLQLAGSQLNHVLEVSRMLDDGRV